MSEEGSTPDAETAPPEALDIVGQQPNTVRVNAPQGSQPEAAGCFFGHRFLGTGRPEYVLTKKQRTFCIEVSAIGGLAHRSSKDPFAGV